MAIRTTNSAVEGIIEVDSSIPMTPFIEVASSIVDTVLDLPSVGYSTTVLELIERWLSAHFYAIRDPRPESEKAGPVSQKFQSEVDLGFNVTHYGQQAMRIDTKGLLASLDKSALEGKSRVIGMTYLGTTTSSQETAFDATP